MKIKKSMRLACIAVILANSLRLASAQAADALAPDDPVRLNDMVITLLMPAVTKAAEHFYEPYLTIAPTVVPYYSSQIIQIRGGEHIHEGVYNSHYTVVLEVFPYIGPHNAVGRDRITLEVQPDGVAVTDYKHCESYPLPPNDQPLLKKPLP